jgi:uncharacterized protein YbaP (TraB family)
MTGRNSLWEFGSAGTTHHLLGSIHLLREDAYPLSAPIEAAYDSAEVLVAETDQSSVSQEELGRLYVTRAHYERGQSLRGSVSGATFNLVWRMVREIGADLSAVNKVKPFFLAMEVSNYVANSMGMSGTHGIDGYFLARAKADGKEVICLETVAEQMDLIASIPPEAQEDSLADTLKSLDDVADRLEKIARPGRPETSRRWRR